MQMIVLHRLAEHEALLTRDGQRKLAWSVPQTRGHLSLHGRSSVFGGRALIGTQASTVLRQSDQRFMS